MYKDKKYGKTLLVWATMTIISQKTFFFNFIGELEDTLCCSATLLGSGAREARPSARRTSAVKRERRERRRAVREEVTEEEMMGNSLPPFSPLGTYFTPAVNKSPFSTTLVPMIGS